MAQSAPGVPSELDRLNQRVDELELRIARLEQHSEPAAVAVANPPQVAMQPAAPARADLPLGTIPALGRAVLGLAGAYLLRALAESGSVPQIAVVLVGIFYAALWLVLAARSHSKSRFASAAYVVTSAMILSPLIWECTARFQALSPAFAAMTLWAFFTFSVMIGSRARLQVMPWISTVAAIVTAFALIIATHAVVPFVSSLLGIALVTEVAGCFGYSLTTRIPAAIAADLAILLLLAIMTASTGVPESYLPAAAATIEMLCVALLLAYGINIAVRGFLLRLPIGLFESIQALPAVALATAGVWRASHGGHAALLGATFFLLSGACYWGALMRFTADVCTRNRRLAANWAAMFFVAASLLVLPPNLCVIVLSFASMLAAFLYTHGGRISLGMHSSAYLAAAAVLSQFPAYAADALAGSVPALPHWSVFVLSGSALSSYLIGSRMMEARVVRRILWALPAIIVAFCVAALAVAGTAALASPHIVLSLSGLSVVRTVITCLLALALAFAGSHWERIELCWAAYVVTIFGTLKLLFEDLRFGSPASLVISLLSYGLILIIVPRMTRRALGTAS